MISVATPPDSALTALPPSHRTKMIATSSPISILKSSKSAGMKRKMNDVDLAPSPPSSLPDALPEDAPPLRKRPRVTFDDKNIQAHEPSSEQDGTLNAASAGKKPLPIVREEIRRAIHRHVSAADSAAYDRIKDIFAADPKKADDDQDSYDLPTHTTLKLHLTGLLSHIASLNRDCSGLVNSVISSEWLGRDEAYVKLYIRFLGNLCAAQGTYLGVVLRMLASKFTGVPQGAGRLPGYPIVNPSQICTRVHMALRYVLGLVPAGSGALSPILSICFPFDTVPAKSFIAYTRNLIRIITYAPELQSDILALITEKLVKVDVQIQVDLEDVEDEIGDELLLESGEGDEELDDEESDLSDDDDDDDKQRSREMKESIQKVDGMIDILFNYYAISFTAGSLVDQENTLDLLLSHFQTIILPTYRSRHTQFLLFHFSQSSPELVDRFASACIQLVFSKLQAGLVRQSAAAYLASFVARGAHISGEVVRDVFDLLLTHLDDQRLEYDSACRGPELRRYGPFYSTAQALLYIFCFRWRDLTVAASEGDSAEQVEDLEPSQVTFPPRIKELLHKSIYSRLNPLKICSPGIVAEFARIAHHFQLLYVYPLLETNKRLRVSAFRNLTSLAGSNYGQVQREIRAGDNLGYQLDAYFPFDPYQLPRSRRWIEGDYVEWRGVPGLDQNDDSDSGADDDEDDDDDEDATGTDEG